MTTVSESDTVIVTSDGRARLNVEKLFAKQHVRESLEEMREKIRHSAEDAHPSTAKRQEPEHP